LPNISKLVKGRHHQSEGLGHLLYVLFSRVFSRLHVLPNDTIFEVDTIAWHSYSRWKCQHWADCAAITDLRTGRNLAFHPEFIEVSDIRAVYLRATLEQIVATNFHLFFYKVALFVLTRLVPYLDEFLDDRVVADYDVATFRNYRSIHVHNTPFSKVDISSELCLGADDSSGHFFRPSYGCFGPRGLVGC
jgi:hypothetical protein